MSNMFNDPGSMDSLPLADLLGSLLLVTVHEETPEMQTVHGPTTAIRADVAVLDGDLVGVVYSDTLVFPKVLKSQLRGSVGGMVVGRLAQGEKKQGLNAPWILETATDADKTVAQAHVDGAAQAEVEYAKPF